PSECVSCPQTLANTNLQEAQCAVHRTCVSCSQTQVSYSRVGDCLTASISCPSPPSSPRLRLLRVDNTYQDIPYSGTVNFSCINGSWSYNDTSGKSITNITKAICFGRADGFQQSPVNLNTSKAVHTPLFNSSEFKINYGVGNIDGI
ncbi:hypothetical protein PMAYCL1PPCAC_01104, partial [Pristionchus mayeri]